MSQVHAPNFPFAKYAPPALSAAAPRLIMWLGEQQAAQAEWWASVPWGLLSFMALAWLFGVAYADFWNRDSALRAWVRWRFRLFEPGEGIEIQKGHYAGAEYSRLGIKIRFRKNLRNVSVLLHVFENIQNDKIMKRTTLTLGKNINVVKGEEQTYIFVNSAADGEGLRP